ncbi:LINE-1 retrotransposable element ORF2 protein [Euphorbia peplus]|nr:LINE-1 retrotransposable element ORF2 protein [Euphorbia peplus]
MSFIIWNCFGAGGAEFQRALRHLVRVHNPLILILIETRVPGSRAMALGQSLNFSNVDVVEAEGFSGGIWMFWNSSAIKIDILLHNKQYLHAQVTMTSTGLGSCPWLFTAVYVRPQQANKKLFFDDIRVLHNSITIPCLIAGDFNSIKTSEEKRGGSWKTLDRCASFANWINDLQLVDLGFVGPQFTWFRGVTPRTRVACRLDRALSNTAWRLLYPEAFVRHLPRNKSDHVPLLIKLNNNSSPPAASPFRFQAAWLTHPDFHNVISPTWSPGKGLMEGLGELSSTLRDWNIQVFGNVFYRKRRLYNRLGGVQARLAQCCTGGLLKLERQILEELNEVLRQEEMIWFQKSRVQWLLFGDRNTTFFHTSTIIRRRRNKVEGLQNEDGIWVWDQLELKNIAVRFFLKLYTEDYPSRPQLISRCLFPSISETEYDRLCCAFSATEVKSAIFSMAAFKAPGPDGFHASFFQKCWSTMEASLCSSTLNALNHNIFEEHINDTHIALIPKIGNPETFSHFRPIGLCNVAYKVITKCIVARLKLILRNVVSPIQSSFVPGRQITDNIIIMQEAVASFKKKTGVTGGMILKLDLEKAYDRINWDFLRDTLSVLGLPRSLIEVIMTCVSTSHLRILWNGEPTHGFTPSRGLRQGDPLSPYLFVLCMERLNQLIIDSINAREWKPVRLSQSGPKTSHIFFADDIVLVAEASVRQAQVIKSVLDYFCSCSGQKVSFAKSRVFFSENTNDSVQDFICAELGVSKTDDLGKYLGVPIVHDRVTKANHRFVIDRVKGRLAGWKAKCLSFAGRTTLVRSVLSALPTYTMQSVLLPLSTCKVLDGLNRQFLWGAKDGERRMSLVKWDSVCQNRRDGGLGIKGAHDMNLALLSKLGWRIITEPQTLWVTVLRSKYGFNPDDVHVFKPKPKQSHTWKAIVASSPILVKGLSRIVRSGYTTRFWLDKWVDDFRLCDMVVQQIPSDQLQLKVKDYWIPSKSWDWLRIGVFLPNSIILKLASYVILSENGEEDGWYWSASPSGNFSVKSAYLIQSKIAGSMNPNTLVNWDCVWKLNSTERIRCFLWLVLHNGILVNVNRVRRRISTSDKCPSCSGSESTLHLLRDCPQTQVLWRRFVPQSQWSLFFNVDFHVWMVGNLTLQLKWKEFAWPTVFSMICWWLWKWRNNLIFNGGNNGAFDQVQFISNRLEEFVKATVNVGNIGGGSLHPRIISWICPDVGWVKLNTDGMSKGNPGISGTGGLIRDSNGMWLCGFMCNLGICTALLAELWGLYYGLEMAWKKGYRRVIVEIDSLIVLKLVMDGERVFHRYYWLIEGCKLFLKHDWEIKMQHQFREGNRAADWLANFAGASDLGHHEFDAPPAGLQFLLAADITGEGVPRVVRM